MNFIILTRDCHGYQYCNGLYNSPTIGNCMNIPDFINFLKNLEKIPKLKLTFNEKSEKKYPVGILDISNEIKINIHFMHDSNKLEVINKWNRRIERMDNNTSQKYLFLNDCDLNGINNNLDFYIEEFFEISYGIKVLFCKKSTFDSFSQSTKSKTKLGTVVIIPDNCVNGIHIYNYVKKNMDIYKKIFSI